MPLYIETIVSSVDESSFFFFFCQNWGLSDCFDSNIFYFGKRSSIIYIKSKARLLVWVGNLAVPRRLRQKIKPDDPKLAHSCYLR